MKAGIKVAIFLSLFVLPAAIWAQGSGSSRPTVNTSGASRTNTNSTRNFFVNRSVKGHIVSAKEGVITVETKKEKKVSAQITLETIFFIGKKKYELKELKPDQIKIGQRVRLRYVEDRRTKLHYVQSIRVLKQKEIKQ